MTGSITKHLVRLIVVLLITGSANASSSIITQDIVFTGKALDLKNDSFLYEEIHTLTVDQHGLPLREIVEYRAPTGETLGIKRMEYTTLSAPDYEVEFQILDRLEQVTSRSGELVITRNEKTVIPLPEDNYAIDGGFHYFIQQNFETLVSGEAVDFNFLSAGRGSFIPLSIEPVSTEGNELTLKLTLQNFFLSKLVKPIWLTYRISDLQLVSYEGLTNVPDENKKLYNAKIVYQYPQEIANVTLP